MNVTLGKYPNYLPDPYEKHKDIARVCTIQTYTCVLCIYVLSCMYMLDEGFSYLTYFLGFSRFARCPNIVFTS